MPIKKKQLKQVNFRIPIEFYRDVQAHIDGVNVVSIQHLCRVLLNTWLQQRRMNEPDKKGKKK